MGISFFTLFPGPGLSIKCSPSLRDFNSYSVPRAWVEYIPGDLNLIITVPHNGKEKPDGLEDRFKGELDIYNHFYHRYLSENSILSFISHIPGKMVTRTARAYAISLALRILM